MKADDPAREARLDPAWMRRAEVAKLLGVLNGGGEETRVVGGAVRNALLGIAVTEIDLATTALPEEVVGRAVKAGFKTVPKGFEHGTVMVVVDGEPFEVTTLRADIETDGRHAKVRFGRSFAKDAVRRDFTINALYATPEGRVLDYVGGLADLGARRVRFIGDARTRIREDYLRCLRFFRFHAVFGDGPLDRQGFDAVVRERHGLARLSRERVAAELVKVLAAPGAAAMSETMSEAGLLGPLLGGVAYPARLGRVAAIERARGEGPDVWLRLAALAVLIAEDAQRLRASLRLSNDVSKRLVEAARALAAVHGSAGAPKAAAVKSLLFAGGRRAACDALTLAHAESAAPVDDADWAPGWRLASEAAQPQLPITGADVVARGIASGPKVGEILKVLQAYWIRAGFPREPAALAKLLDDAILAVRQLP